MIFSYHGYICLKFFYKKLFIRNLIVNHILFNTRILFIYTGFVNFLLKIVALLLKGFTQIKKFKSTVLNL